MALNSLPYAIFDNLDHRINSSSYYVYKLYNKNYVKVLPKKVSTVGHESKKRIPVLFVRYLMTLLNKSPTIIHIGSRYSMKNVLFLALHAGVQIQGDGDSSPNKI